MNKVDVAAEGLAAMLMGSALWCHWYSVAPVAVTESDAEVPRQIVAEMGWAEMMGVPLHATRAKYAEV